MISKWFGRSKEHYENAQVVYDKITSCVRNPWFYKENQVPDTLEGRFDVLLLHMFLVLFRLKKERSCTKDFSQALFEIMIEDLDQNLRINGVGDDGVFYRIRSMSSAYHGRILAYDKAVRDEKNNHQLYQALDRNLFSKTSPDSSSIYKICDYVRKKINDLHNLKINDVVTGKFEFTFP